MRACFKRVLSIIIAMIILVGAVPFSASAQDDIPEKTAAFSLMKTDETVSTVCISLMLDRGIFSSIEVELNTTGLVCTAIGKGDMLERLYDKDWAECYFSANSETCRAAFICSASYHYSGEFLKFWFIKESSDYTVSAVIPACAVVQDKKPVDINVTQPETFVNAVLYSKLSDVRLKYKDSVKLTPRLTADDSAGTYTFYSSDPKTVRIDENGTVYALKEGTAEIKVIYSEPDSVPLFDFCTVTVRMTFWQKIVYYVFFGWIWY